jgi:hypothetical protein
MLGKVALAVVVIIASLFFLLFSFCAVGGGGGDIGMNYVDREIAAVLALVNAGVIGAAVRGLAKLNRKR